jgi:Ni,Fe-hydrogenase III large subunit/Ni,Fe-hydrogenase III component G
VSELATLSAALRAAHADITLREAADRLVVDAPVDNIPDLAVELTTEHGCAFALLLIEENAEAGFDARYFFYVDTDPGRLIEIATTTQNAELPAISDRVHAADWHEREAEDLFEIRFHGHPFLGDFILHDTEWPEGIAPMRHDFDPGRRVAEAGLGAAWRPRQILQEQGALVLPVGPVWADYAESGLWLLETPGEHIRQVHTRLFYKYRGVEKIAEGQQPDQALLLAERFSGSSAIAHAWAYCQAAEKLAGVRVPARAQALRAVFAEFERMRYHATTIAELAGSTGLVVGKAWGQDIEEDLLRIAGDVCGHRYQFGLLAPGGLAWVPDESALARLDEGVAAAAARLAELHGLLATSSSFLDRIEEMGTLSPETAETYGVVGPVARASGQARDLRRALPYGDYAGDAALTLPKEVEGDGYARLRVFFAEIQVSAALIHERLKHLPDGSYSTACAPAPGGALGWTEAPAGGAFHWLRINQDGTIARWRIATPSFRNWHAFHRAVEGPAFQDFHIVMASFGLSVAENDR